MPSLRFVLSLLALGLIASCTEGDRAKIFSAEKPPMVGRCDPQPGYPDPSQRPGCEYTTTTGRGR
jgi:hypothetical protein